jgi:hypothetical protein
LIAAGGDLTTIPDNAVFVVGDQLVFRNQDSAHHQIGPFPIPPRSTGSLVLKTAEKYDYACTIHPTGFIGFDVRPPANLWLLPFPALALGLPLSAVLARLTRREAPSASPAAS